MTCAFTSVARRGHTNLSRLWMLGWIMVILHFTAYSFLSAPGIWSSIAGFVGTAALVWTGLLFTWAAVPYRKEKSSFLIFLALVATTSLYLAVMVFDATPSWDLTTTALLIGAVPLAIALYNLRRFNHVLRWTGVGLYLALSITLAALQFRPGGLNLALNAVLFTVYFGCAIHVWAAYNRPTAGAFIAVSGFFAWAGVFVIGPTLLTLYPALKIDAEVWNLPKYVVAMGMILLLLEDQIEHNKYLALHDELTGLPNRRLFQDRLNSALERARRTGSRTALLQIDLDRFKQVNDTAGHHVGDELLRHVATVFLGRVRRSDTVARTGGDEFSIILEEPTSREDATSVGVSLAELLDCPITIDSHDLHIGASIGIAVFPVDAIDAEALCIAADRRMYDVKNATRETERKIARRAAVRRFPPAEAPGYPPAEAQRG